MGWITPIDITASQLAHGERLQEDKAYSEQYPYYLRLDIKLAFV